MPARRHIRQGGAGHRSDQASETRRSVDQKTLRSFNKHSRQYSGTRSTRTPKANLAISAVLLHLVPVVVPVKPAYAVAMNQLLENPEIDWTACTLVEINSRKLSGVPVLRGTRMQADSIVENHRSGLPADEIAEVFELPVDSVRALLAYAAQHDPALKR